MKNLLLSALMLTGVATFAQETPKKEKVAKQTTTTTVKADNASQVTKTKEVKQDANGDKQVETTTTTKAVAPAEPAATKTTTTTTKKQ